MQFFAVLAATLAIGSSALALPMRELSGRLTIRVPHSYVGIRADDIVVRDTSSPLAERLVTGDSPPAASSNDAAS